MVPREMLRTIRRVEISTRGLVNEFFSGEYHSVFKGRGIDFSEVREYQFGDDIRSIDWNVTARAGRPFVKVFREERALTVMFVVDASASGNFGTRGRTKAQLALEICALLAFSAIKNNDRVGLIQFSDRVEKFVPPRTGRRQALRVLRDLLFDEAKGSGTDIAAALEYLKHVIKRRAVVFLVSDFIADGFMKAVAATSRRHDLVAIRVTDDREKTLPPVGLIEFEDAETGQLLTVNTSSATFRKAFAEQSNEANERLLNAFKKAGVDVVEARTHAPHVEPLRQFFKSRTRRKR